MAKSPGVRRNSNERCVCGHLAGLHRASAPWACRGRECACESFVTAKEIAQREDEWRQANPQEVTDGSHR